MSLPTVQLSELSKKIGQVWWLILLFGIIAGAFGIVAMIYPIKTGIGLMWIVGIFAIAEGLAGLIGAFKADIEGRIWLILYAIFSLVFGLLAVFSPASMAVAFVMVMGIWFIASGILRVVFAIRVRKQIDNEWALIGGGILAIVLGVLLLLAPIMGLAVTVIWVGVCAFFYGVLQIVAAFKVRKLIE